MAWGPARETLYGVGFEGPDPHGVLRARWFGVEFTVEPHPLGGFQVQITRTPSPRDAPLPGGPVLPSDLDALQIREQLWEVTRRFVPTEKHPLLAAHLRPTLEQAETRTMTVLQDGTYSRSILGFPQRHRRAHYRYATATNADRTAAELTARHTVNESLIALLVRSHPDPNVRALAIENPACSPAVLGVAAADETCREVRRGLLRHVVAPDSLLELLAINLLTNGEPDLDIITELLMHPACPQQFQTALMAHLHHASPDRRIQTALDAHHTNEDRRDYLHQELLQRPVRRTYTDRLLQAVLGEDPQATHRLQWLAHHPDPRIQRRSHQAAKLNARRASASQPVA